MRLYFFNPLDKQLAIYDSESEEIILCPRITMVRVAVGDMELDVADGHGKSIVSKKTGRRCGNCGGQGHNAKTCPK